MRASAGVTLCACLSSCLIDSEPPPGARIICRSDEECPGDTQCDTEARLCVSTRGERTRLASVDAWDDQGRYRTRFGPNQSVELQVRANRPARDAPRVALQFPGTTREAVLQETVSDAEWFFSADILTDDNEGPVSVSAELWSPEGAFARDVANNVFFIDTTPPRLTRATITYLPRSGSLLARQVGELSRLSETGSVELWLTFDEELMQDPADPAEISVISDLLPSSMDRVLVINNAGGSLDALARSWCPIVANNIIPLPDLGLPVVQLPIAGRVTDLSGNVLDAADGLRVESVTEQGVPVSTPLVIELDLTPPVLRDSAVHLRRPWGVNAWSKPGVGGRSPENPAQEVRGLAVTDEVSTRATDPMGNERDYWVWVFALAGRSSSGILLGKHQVDGAGNLGADRPLASPPASFALPGNAAEVTLVAVDAAGNESAPLWVSHGEWVASFEQTDPVTLGPRDNPHQVLTIGEAAARPNDPLAMPLTSVQRQKLTYDDCLGCLPPPSVTAISARRWLRRDLPNLPAQAPAVLYRTGTGELLVYGGLTADGASDGFFAYRDGVWRDLSSEGTSPGARVGAAVAYDPDRDRVVLFGGTPGDLRASRKDTWEWDGERWADVTPPTDPTQPPALMHAAMAYDPVREQMILAMGGVTVYGLELVGANDLWAWDGVTWTPLTDFSTSPEPEPRYGAAMAVDAASGGMVLFGGYRDRLVPGCPAGATTLPALEETGTTSNACVFGDTWRFDLATGTWSEVVDAAPPPDRFDAVMVPTATGPLLYAGCADGVPNGRCFAAADDLWQLVADDWQPLSPASMPDARAAAGGAYDPMTETFWMYGGAAVLARDRALPCDDAGSPFTCPVGARLTQFVTGGLWACECSYSRLWQWRGGAWTGDTGAAETPEAVRHAAVARHAAQGVTAIVGGESSSDTCDGTLGSICRSTWLWDGALWMRPDALQGPADCSQAAPTPFAPCARRGAAMAYRTSASGTPELVLFGGEGVGGECDGASGRCGRTWALRWDDVDDWQWVDACPGCAPGQPSPAPAPRAFAAMAPFGDAVYLYGGVGDRGTECSTPLAREFSGSAYGGSLNACGMGDLWRFDDAGWTLIGPSAAQLPDWPQALWQSPLGADITNNKLLLHSGCTQADLAGECPATYYGALSLAAAVFDIGTTTWTHYNTGLPGWRFGHTLTEDPSRGSLIMFGGRNQYGARFNDVWEWRPTGFTAVVVEGPMPTPRAQHGAVYDAQRVALAVHGGAAGSPVWELGLATSARPAVILAFDWGAAGVPEAELTDLRLAVTATARSYDGTTELSTYAVEGWDRAASAWQPWTCVNAGATANSSRQQCAPPDGALGNWVYVATQTLYVRVVPSGGLGSGSSLPQVTVDLAELQVKYDEP